LARALPSDTGEQNRDVTKMSVIGKAATLLDPVVIAQALREATDAIIATPDAAAAQLVAVDERHDAVVIKRLTAAIGAGGELSSLVAELRAREQERGRLEQEREQLRAWMRVDRLDVRRLEADLQTRGGRMADRSESDCGARSSGDPQAARCESRRDDTTRGRDG
jgi:hypothetical protein